LIFWFIRLHLNSLEDHFVPEFNKVCYNPVDIRNTIF
jgi:hypothetical protein